MSYQSRLLQPIMPYIPPTRTVGGVRYVYDSRSRTYVPAGLTQTAQRASGELVPGITQTVAGINTTLTNISSGTFWMRVGVGIVGLALVIVGVGALSARPVKQVAQTVAPTAKIVKRLRPKAKA